MFDSSQIRARSDILDDDYLFWTNTGDGLDGDVYKLTLAELVAKSITAAGVLTSDSASAFAVGPNGATNPAFSVDASVGSLAAGLTVTGAIAAGTVALAVISSGSNANLSINAKGTGTIAIGSVSTGIVTITPATVLASTLSVAGKVSLGLNGGAASASGLLMGVGTSLAPAATAAAGNMFAEFRTKSTATSGDSRGLYWRHELAGIGVSGESVRAFTKVSAAAATARGAHFSLDFADAGSVSGFGAGIDAQVLFGNASNTSTVAAINAELYAGGSSTAIGAGTASVIRVSIGGDGTGAADIRAKAAFLSFSSASDAGAAGIIDSDITALTGKAGLKVYVNGTLYGYIPIVTGS